MTVNGKEYEVQDHGEYVNVKVGEVWITVPEGASVEEAVEKELKNPTYIGAPPEPKKPEKK